MNAKQKMVEVRADSLEAMAEHLGRIASSFKKLSQPGGLTEDAIVTLIHRDIGPEKISRAQIKLVLQSAASLDKFTVKRKPAKS